MSRFQRQHARMELSVGQIEARRIVGDRWKTYSVRRARRHRVDYVWYGSVLDSR